MILKGLSSGATGGDILHTQGLTINFDQDYPRLKNAALDEEEILMMMGQQSNRNDLMVVEEFEFNPDNHNEQYVKV